MTPYRTGPQLIELFNAFGYSDVYGRGFPTRVTFARDKLNELNGTSKLGGVIEYIFDPIEFHETGLDLHKAMADANVYLRRDNLELALAKNDTVRLLRRSGDTVSFRPTGTYEPLAPEFVREHVEKCERKLSEQDFRGAITNARSLCEEILRDIEKRLDPDVGKYDGDLPKLYKRVRKLLKMDPGEYVGLDSVLLLLSGLTTMVDGLAGMSNTQGDRHGGGGYDAKEHHARLAVNAANTLCTYLVSSFARQHLTAGSG